MRTRILSFGLLAVIGASLLLVLTFPYGRDQGIYAVVSRTILEGGAPYRDAWDFKPPAIFFFYALSRALFGAAPWAIRALEVALLAAMAWAMVALAQRFWGDRRIGLLAAALAVLVHAQLDFWHTAQPETFGGALTVLALWAGTSRRATTSPWPLVAAGALFGLAALLKPPLGGGALVLALWAARRGGVWRASALLFAGGALVVAACVGWFFAVGALDALAEALFVFAPSYTALGWHARDPIGLFRRAAADWLLGYSGPLAAGVVLLALLRKRAHDRLAAIRLLAAIVLVDLLGVAMQGKFFPYHYGACWPPTALLAALGWWHAFKLALARGQLAVSGMTALACAALVARTATRDVPGTFWHRAAARARLGWHDEARAPAPHGSVADVDAASNRAMAEALRRWVPAHGAMYVWGFEPVLYDLADRRAPTRFIYNVPQRAPWTRAAARGELMADLARRPPEAIVVVSGDRLPMVLGHGDDSASELDDFSELSRFLRERYGKRARIDDLELYVRRAP